MASAYHPDGAFQAGEVISSKTVLLIYDVIYAIINYAKGHYRYQYFCIRFTQ